MSDLVGNPEDRFSRVAALLDPGHFGPDFWDVAPCRNIRKESCISVVKLGFS